MEEETGCRSVGNRQIKKIISRRKEEGAVERGRLRKRGKHLEL